jgi:hypothetical protein
VNIKQSKLGTKYFTVWYAGPLSINNHRGQLEFIPSNLQQFSAADPKAGGDVPPDLSLPDYQRDVQFTVNGQFQPVIKSKAGQTEIWVLANVSDIAYINVQLTETATGISSSAGPTLFAAFKPYGEEDRSGVSVPQVLWTFRPAARASSPRPVQASERGSRCSSSRCCSPSGRPIAAACQQVTSP